MGMGPDACNQWYGNGTRCLQSVVWEWDHMLAISSMGMGPDACNQWYGNGTTCLQSVVWEWDHMLVISGMGMGMHAVVRPDDRYVTIRCP